jgi:hypothetical protein
MIENDAYGGIISDGSGIICSSDVRARYAFIMRIIESMGL